MAASHTSGFLEGHQGDSTLESNDDGSIAVSMHYSLVIDMTAKDATEGAIFAKDALNKAFEILDCKKTLENSSGRSSASTSSSNNTMSHPAQDDTFDAYLEARLPLSPQPEQAGDISANLDRGEDAEAHSNEPTGHAQLPAENELTNFSAQDNSAQFSDQVEAEMVHSLDGDIAGPPPPLNDLPPGLLMEEVPMEINVHREEIHIDEQ